MTKELGMRALVWVDYVFDLVQINQLLNVTT
jgi:hypothetical protein